MEKYAVDQALQVPTKSILRLLSSQKPLATVGLKFFFIL